VKIKLLKPNYNYTYKGLNTNHYCQKQFDYICKYLNFDKLYKDWFIYFNNKETEDWFHKTYIEENWLKSVYNDSPEGYKWLKNNWGNGKFKIDIWYPDKQEFKTAVNRVINTNLKKDYF